MPASSKAYEAMARARRLATRLKGVVGVDLGYVYRDSRRTRQVGIRFHVEGKLPVSDLTDDQMVPKQIMGFPCDVLEATYEPHSQSSRAEFSMLRPGISVGNADQIETGTLGAFVRYRLTGETCILSNWHVLCGSPDAKPGNRISQPGPNDTGNNPVRPVAELTRWANLGHGYDAAIARLVNQTGFDRSIFGLDKTAVGVAEPELGMKLVKSGISTGITWAMVDGIEGSYRIPYTNFGEQVRWMDAIRLVPDPGHPTDEISLGGDSGAVWIQEDSCNAVALHFAGEPDLGPTAEYALAQRMVRVLELLDAELV